MEDELPSVSITMRFLDLCDHYGSQRAIVGLVAAGRKVGVSGLPGHADWPAWGRRRDAGGGQVPRGSDEPQRRSRR